MVTLESCKELIETRLDIKDTLVIESGKIIPNKKLLTKKYIKQNQLDDLFMYYKLNNQLVFTNRLMSLIGEITDRQLLTGHYFMELRDSN